MSKIKACLKHKHILGHNSYENIFGNIISDYVINSRYLYWKLPNNQQTHLCNVNDAVTISSLKVKINLLYLQIV